VRHDRQDCHDCRRGRERRDRQRPNHSLARAVRHGLLGRKQFETVGKPLPGRTNIVITRQQDYQPNGVLVFHDIETALAQARQIAEADGVDEIMIIGGGELYAQLMDRADRLYITHIDLSPAGDVRFPAIAPKQWTVVDLPEVAPSPRDEASYRVKVYERRGDAAH
jgi:dihydrofolate reductase